MTDIVAPGAGLGGAPMIFELVDQLRPNDRLPLIGQSAANQSAPSNPWVAVGWCNREDVEVGQTEVTRRKKIRFPTTGARCVPAPRRRWSRSSVC